MTDPFSVAASIIAVIQITGSLVSLCYDYRSGVNNAPKEMMQVTDEVFSLRDHGARVDPTGARVGPTVARVDPNFYKALCWKPNTSCDYRGRGLPRS
jgi:hypothetical protein